MTPWNLLSLPHPSVSPVAHVLGSLILYTNIWMLWLLLLCHHVCCFPSSSQPWGISSQSLAPCSFASVFFSLCMWILFPAFSCSHADVVCISYLLLGNKLNFVASNKNPYFAHDSASQQFRGKSVDKLSFSSLDSLMCFQPTAGWLGGFASGGWLAVTWVPSVTSSMLRCATELSWWQHSEKYTRALEHRLRGHTVHIRLPRASHKTSPSSRAEEIDCISWREELQHHITEKHESREVWRIVATFVIYPRLKSSAVPWSLIFQIVVLYGISPLHCLPSVQVQHKPYGNLHPFYPQSSSSCFHHLSQGLHHFQMQKISFD